MANQQGTNGLDKIGAALKKHRADILLTVAALATAESKWKAIGAAIKDFAIWKMIGPLGLVLGSLKGIEGMVRSILRETGSLEAVLKRMSQMQGLTRQFTTLLGSIGAARRRVAELVQFTNSQKLFNLEQAGGANRELEILTKGLFSTKRAMTIVGDASAGTENGIGDVAARVGELHRELQDGAPIDAAAGALAKMGVITEQGAEHLVKMQAGGAGLNDVFGELTQQLGKHEGAMKAWTESVDGVTAGHEKAREALAKKFGEPFKEAEIARMKDATAVLNAMQGPVSNLAQWLSKLASPIENIGVRLGGWMDRLGVLRPALAGATTMIKTLASGLIVLGTAWGVRALSAFIASVVKVSATSQKGAQALTALRASSAAAAGAISQLRAGNTALAASQAAASGGALRQAAALGVAAVATRGFALAVRAVMASTGIGALIVLLGIGVEKLWNFATATSKAAEAQRELAKANAEADDALRKQIGEVHNLDDAQRALITTTEELAAAQRVLNELREKKASKGEIAQQAGRVAALQSRADSFSSGIRDGRFGRSAGVDAAQRSEAARGVRLDDMARDNAIESSTGSERLRLLEAKRQQLAMLESTGANTAMERALIDEAVKKKGLPGAGAQGFREALERKAGSPIIREERAIQDMRSQRNPDNIAEIQQREARLALAKERTEGAAAGGAKEIEQQIQFERKRQDLRYEDLQAEKAIAALRDRGFDREEGAAKARLEAMRGQQQVMRAFGDEEGAEEFQGRIDAAERELRLMQERAKLQREMDAAHLRVVALETAAATAAMRGSFAEADAAKAQAISDRDDLDNRRSFEEKMDSGQFTREQANMAVSEEQKARERERAARKDAFRSAAARDIEEGGLAASGDAEGLARLQNKNALLDKIREGMASGLGADEATGLAVPQILNQIAQGAGPVAATSIQRIGGGGGAAGGDIEREKRDLIKDAVGVLRQIAGNTVGEAGTPDTGESYTGEY